MHLPAVAITHVQSGVMIGMQSVGMIRMNKPLGVDYGGDRGDLSPPLFIIWILSPPLLKMCKPIATEKIPTYSTDMVIVPTRDGLAIGRFGRFPVILYLRPPPPPPPPQSLTAYISDQFKPSHTQPNAACGGIVKKLILLICSPYLRHVCTR